MPRPKNSLAAFCLALLILDILYCLETSLSSRMPAWSMFAAVERPDFVLKDKDGAVLDLRRHLPKGSYLIDERGVETAAACVCAKNPERAPLLLEFARTRRAFNPCR